MTPKNELDMHEQRRGLEPDVEEMHEVVYREKTEPHEGGQPLPTEMIVAAFALLLFGGWYLGEYSADFAVDRYEGPDAYAVSGSATQTSATDQSGPDPMLVGRRIFNNCITCHQANGQGIAGQYPPLDGNPMVTGREDNLTRILLHGLMGPVEVLGRSYNGQMPKWSQLDDSSIAAVLTYVRGSWSNQASPVDEAFVASIRQQYPGRSIAWTAGELEAAPEIKVEQPEPEAQASENIEAESAEPEPSQPKSSEPQQSATESPSSAE